MNEDKRQVSVVLWDDCSEQRPSDKETWEYDMYGGVIVVSENDKQKAVLNTSFIRVIKFKDES